MLFFLHQKKNINEKTSLSGIRLILNSSSFFVIKIKSYYFKSNLNKFLAPNYRLVAIVYEVAFHSTVL